MGCCFSSGAEAAADAAAGSAPGGVPAAAPGLRPSRKEAPTKSYSKPRWKASEPLTAQQLARMRDEYWDTQPHYGGDRVIWDAIKAAVEAPDMATTRIILEAANVIVARPDMGVMYDELGGRYVLPNYVLSEPSNLARGSSGGGGGGGSAAAAQQQQRAIQLQAVLPQPQQAGGGSA